MTTAGTMAQRLGQAQRQTPAQRQGQRQTQGQSLVMTPQLTQSIRMLAMSQAELDATVDKAVSANPFLKTGSKPLAAPTPRLPPASHALADGRLEDVWERVSAPPSLAAHLGLQIARSGAAPRVVAAARSIAVDLNEAGRLADPGETRRCLQASDDEFAAALELVRGLEPSGVGARNLQDCLTLQLQTRDRFDPAMAAIVSRLDLVANGDRPALRRLSGLDDADLADALGELRALDPAPGLRFVPQQPVPAPPDVLIRRDERGAWTVELNPETLPRVLVDREYHATVAPGLRTQADRTFVADALQEANWLVRSLDQRARTIVKVVGAVTAAQDAFLAQGVQALQPMTMREIADRIEMHESTVSRVTNAKTVLSPQGLHPLKFFFTTAIPGRSGASHSAAAVRDRIRTLVAREGTAVLSDDALVCRLREDGVEIARRTVAKYREALAIPSSVQRRRRIGVGGGSEYVAAGAAV